LLFDLVAAPAGSFGPFFGLSLLGIEWKLSRGFYLTVDPTFIALPVPHVTGVPFVSLLGRPGVRGVNRVTGYLQLS